MKMLKIMIGLTFMLSLVACATKPAVLMDSKVEVRESLPAPEPTERLNQEEETEQKRIVWPDLPGWEKVPSPQNVAVYFHRMTDSNIRTAFLPTAFIGDSETLIKEFHQQALVHADLEMVSPIGFSEDRTTAWFTYAHKLETKDQDRLKGKMVVLMLLNWPEATAFCQGDWLESVQDQIMPMFDQFWMGIDVVDSPEDAEDQFNSCQP